MYKRLPYYLIFSLAVCCIVSAPALSQVKGAAVQTWHYDPLKNLVTLQIVNTSHKDITAFNIAIKETYADGRVDKHELLEELVGKMLAFKELQGTSHEASFRKQYGDGAFHPGEVHDELVPVQPGFTNIEAVIDVVTYIDGTADSSNNDGLQRIVDERKATVASRKMATDIIKSALADPSDTDPATTAARKIKDRATVWRATKHTTVDLDPVVLETISAELTAKKRDALQKIVDRENATISMLSVHAAVKAGGPQ